MEAIEKLKSRIEDEIKRADNTAEELIQECDNEEDAQEYIFKSDAYSQCLEWIRELRPDLFTVPEYKVLLYIQGESDPRILTPEEAQDFLKNTTQG